MTRVMLNSKKLTKRLWAEIVNTTCHTISHVYLRPSTKITPYELWKGKKCNVSYFHIFSSTCYILNDHEHLGKFDSKSDTGVFLGYSNNSIVYRIYNMRTQIIIESVKVIVDGFCDFFEFYEEKVISRL